MANITRIKNNQITDSTITYSKIAPGTLVGSVFNPDLTLNSNVTIIGNLSITGTPTTIQSTNTYVNDPLVVFNNGYTGTPSYDIGIIANRNLGSLAPYGSVNTAFIWSESDGAWIAVATTETGATTGSINNSGWANIKAGNLTSVSSTVNGKLDVTGNATISGTLTATGSINLNTVSVAGLQALAIGNVTPGTGAFTTLTSSTTYTFNTGTSASLQSLAIGNVTPGTGAFTTLTASGVTTLTNSTASTDTTSGALQVTGGVGVGGAVYAGSLYDNANRVITGLTSTGSGNLTVGGTVPSLTIELPSTGPGATTWGGITQLPVLSVDAYGRVSTASNVALNTIAVTEAGNTAEITANAAVGKVGFSLTTTGVNAGNYGDASTIPTIVVDSKGRITSITTNAASTSFSVAGTSGTSTVSAGDTLTFAGTYGVTVAVGDTYANISTPQDLQTTANPAFNNLTTASVQGVIGNVTPATATFTTATTGGLQAVAIGNVTPGAATFTTLTSTSTTSLGLTSAIAINSTPIGNATPSTGAFTTGNFNSTLDVTGATTLTTATTGGLQAKAIGNVTPGSGAFTTGNFNSTLDVTGATTLTTATVGGLQAVAIGNVTPGTGAFTTTTAGSLQAVAIGNVTPGTGAFTTTTVDGLQAVAIGNVTPGTAAFTTLTATGTTSLGLTSAIAINSTPIGNASAASGTFTTLTTGGVVQMNNTTESTSSTTGAVRISGGVGVAKNLNVGGNVVVTGNLTVQGTMTAIQSQTLDVTDLNITVAKGAGSAAAADGAGLTVDGANATITYANADDTWNLNKGLKGTAATFNTETVGGLQAKAIGNVTPGTAQFTTLGASGASTLDTVTAASYQGVIGNVTPAAGTFTTGTFNTSATVNGTLAATTINAVTLGNVGAKVTGDGGFLSNIIAGNVVGTLNTANVAYYDVITNLTNNQTYYVEFANVTSGNSVTGASSSLTFNPGAGSGTLTAGTFSGAVSASTINATGASTLNTVTAASYQGVIGNVTPAAATFTSITTAGSSGNISGVNYYIGSVVNAATIGNTGTTLVGTLATAAQPNVTSVGTLTGLAVSGSSSLNTVTAASYQGVIGNVTPAAATFTTATIQQGLQGTAIGNVTPSTGAFTTLSANVWANITATTESTSHTTGALLVAGGVGIQGNLNAGSATSYNTIGGNLLLGNPAGGFSGGLTTLQINQNPVAPQTSTSGIHLSAKEGFTGKITVDSFGTGVSSTFVARASRGTATTPTAVQAGDTIGGLVTRGYGSTGYAINSVATSAGLIAKAAENYTDSAQGQTLILQTVKTGTTTAIAAMKIDASGNIVIPATEGSGSVNDGALTVKGGVGIAANVNIGGNLTVTDFIRGSSGLQVAGKLSTLDTTNTTEPGAGSFITPGGASINGNVYVGENIYIGPSSFNTELSVPTIIAVANGTDYAQMAIVNTAGSGSSDYAAYTANGNDAGGWVDMGIAGNTFSDPNYTITKPEDGYLFTRPTTNTVGGNLIIATSEAGSYNDVVIGVGSFDESAEVARFHGNVGNSGTFTLKLPTNAVPAANTGAFQVWGGESISGNSYIGGAMTINGSQTANYDFKVNGKTDTSLIWARPGASYDQVVIGGSLTPSGLTGGAKLIVNSTDSIMLPVGGSGDRPSSQGFSDVEGMFRYNTTLGAIEWYTGAVWQTATTTFTIITDEQFNGDGSTTEFTLGGSTTTAGTIVSINGVVQIPTLAYSITGAGNTTLEFTEAPESGDVIDVRRLTTTQTLFGVASPNGKNAFQTDNNGVYIYTGITGGSSTATTSWDGYGNEVSNRANVTVASANTATTIVTMDATTYRSGKFVIQATHGTDYQVMEALVVHDGTTASVMPYGIVQTNGNLGVVSATYSSGNVLLQFVASNTSTIVRTKSDFLTI